MKKLNCPDSRQYTFTFPCGDPQIRQSCKRFDSGRNNFIHLKILYRKSVCLSIAVGKNIEGCDAVLTTDDLSVIADAIAAAKRGRSIIVQGLAFAIVLKIAILILTLIGIAPFWLAVLADSGVAILTVANAMRAGR